MIVHGMGNRHESFRNRFVAGTHPAYSYPYREVAPFGGTVHKWRLGSGPSARGRLVREFPAPRLAGLHGGIKARR